MDRQQAVNLWRKRGQGSIPPTPTTGQMCMAHKRAVNSLPSGAGGSIPSWPTRSIPYVSCEAVPLRDDHGESTRQGLDLAANECVPSGMVFE